MADKGNSVSGGSVPWKDQRTQNQEAMGSVRSELTGQMWWMSQM